MGQTLLKPLISDIKNFVFDTLFPIHCLLCGAEGRFICQKCVSMLMPANKQYCLVCQKPTPFGLTHPGCATGQAPDGAISIFDYHDKKVADILIEAKYKFLPGTYDELGKIIADKIPSHYPLLPAACSLIPLPLHKSRLRWRGFNQAEVFCQALSQQLRLPVIDALQRAKSTKTQKDLKKDQRLENVKDAFALKQGADVNSLNLILVDDVTTTGATLVQASQVLKRNGAASVFCLTVAKD